MKRIFGNIEMTKINLWFFSQIIEGQSSAKYIAGDAISSVWGIRNQKKRTHRVLALSPVWTEVDNKFSKKGAQVRDIE